VCVGGEGGGERVTNADLGKWGCHDDRGDHNYLKRLSPVLFMRDDSLIHDTFLDFKTENGRRPLKP